MTEEAKEWVAPEKVEDLFDSTGPSKFSSINSPEAGARVTKALEKGKAPYQLYSIATPNGIKVNILLEELGVDYDAHTIKINGDQFTSGFVEVNPNSKIPALVDWSDAKNPINLFESGSIMLHLADKHKQFVPPLEDPANRAQVINWLMWQMGSGPYFGQFGHFFNYAPKHLIETRNYGVSRYGMEVQRLLSVLDNTLSESKSGYVADWGYSIADMAIWPWVYGLVKFYKGDKFLGTDKYKHVNVWMELVGKRPSVEKGLTVTPFA